MPTEGSGTARTGLAARLIEPLRVGSRAIALAAWTAALTQAAVSILHRHPPERRTPQLQRWAQHWARGLLAVFGVEQHWAPGVIAPASRARLVVANHRSPLDIILMLQHFGGSVLARHDLEGWPVLGRAAREAGTIFVDRDDPNSGLHAVREIRRRLLAGQTVIVFPEGTTHRGDKVASFRGGAFAAIRGLDVELLPVGLAYEPGAECVDERFPDYVARMSRRRRTRVGLCAGPGWTPQGTREAIAAKMQADVQALVGAARARLTGLEPGQT
jgi:lyso-ornithine lipid O-acyltransferase